MAFILESDQLADYLQETSEINYSDPLIRKTSSQLFQHKPSEIEKAQLAYEFVRDQIAHSWDIQSNRVTCSASEVLRFKEGICYAKSNLLAALLRSQGIPTGFCYQRLLLFDIPEDGYSLHAFNAIYISSIGKWIRVDARGNKEGVDAQFSTTEEKLAFPIHEDLDEIDYPYINAKPHPKTISVLRDHEDAITMYRTGLPDRI